MPRPSPTLDARREQLRHQFAVLTARLEDLSVLATAGQAIHPDLKTYQSIARRLEHALQQLSNSSGKMAEGAAQK